MAGYHIDTKLKELQDVNALSPTDGYMLTFDSATGLWIAALPKLDDLDTPDDNTDLDATDALHGLMSKADKGKLDGIEALADVTDAANVDAAGAVMESDLQYGCKVFLNAAQQVIPHATTTIVKLDAEAYDEQGEFDSSVKTGAADATEANKLHDADGGFDAGDVGAVVWNTTDDTYTTVSGFVDSGELDLTDDIMVNGEDYEIFWSRYVATVAGVYLVAVYGTLFQLADGKSFSVHIQKNGSGVYQVKESVGALSNPIAACSAPIKLDVDDYVQMSVYHDNGSSRNLLNNEVYTGMIIQRMR